MTPSIAEALESIDALIADVENKWGDPHTLRHAKEAVADLRALLAAGAWAPDGCAAILEVIRDAPLPKDKHAWRTILKTAQWFQELARCQLAAFSPADGGEP